MRYLKSFNESSEKEEFGWIEEDNKLQRVLEFRDFNESLNFINKLGIICESMNHHPEINWVYNKIKLTLSTHDAGDKITDLDYQLANEINEILKEI
jgi:4a-hydroxytetrahydrobiopterin dehydratase